MHDHLTYEKNKHKEILSKIEFPSIEKQETAPYIFEFINFLRLRSSNNSLFAFSKLDDIEGTLRKQWSALFQRLLFEQRSKAEEEARIDYLSGQIADLKAAFMTSLESNELKEVAKGAIRFRLLIEFVAGLCLPHGSPPTEQALKSDISWTDLLQLYGIVDVQPVTDQRTTAQACALLREDGSYYHVMLSHAALARLANHWEEFRHLNVNSKTAIIDAVLDSERGVMSRVRFVSEPLYDKSEVGSVQEKPFVLSIPLSG